eukprot:tig00021494_g21914.t1
MAKASMRVMITDCRFQSAARAYVYAYVLLFAALCSCGTELVGAERSSSSGSASAAGHAHAREAEAYRARPERFGHAVGWGRESRTVDPRTGEIHLHHSEHRVDGSGQRVRVAYRGTLAHREGSGAGTVSLDEAEGVDALACDGSPALHGGAGHHGAHFGWAPGTVVVGGPEWRCPPFADTPSPADVDSEAAGGLMRRVLASERYPCGVELEAAAGTDREGRREVEVGRAECVRLETAPAALTDIFRSLHLEIFDDAPTAGAAGAAPHSVHERHARPGSGVDSPGQHAAGTSGLHDDAAPGHAYGPARPAARDRERGREGPDRGRRPLFFGSIFRAVARVVAPVVRAVTSAAKVAVNAVATAAKTVVDVSAEVVKTPLKVFNEGLTALDAATGGALAGVTGPLKDLSNNLQNKVDDVKNKIKSKINQIAAFLESLLDLLNCQTGRCTVKLQPITYSLRLQRESNVSPKSADSSNTAAAGGAATLRIVPEEIYTYLATGIKMTIEIEDFKLKQFSAYRYGQVEYRNLLNVTLDAETSVELMRTLFEKARARPPPPRAPPRPALFSNSPWRKFAGKVYAAGPVIFVLTPRIEVGIGVVGKFEGAPPPPPPPPRPAPSGPLSSSGLRAGRAASMVVGLDSKISVGVQAGFRYEGGALRPDAGWLDGKKPLVSFNRPAMHDASIDLSLMLQFIPEGILDIAVYGINLLELKAGIRFQIGLVWSPITAGIIPNVAASVQLGTIFGGSATKVGGIDADVKIKPMDEFVLWENSCGSGVEEEAPEADPAPCPVKPPLEPKVVRRSAVPASLSSGQIDRDPRRGRSTTGALTFDVQLRKPDGSWTAAQSVPAPRTKSKFAFRFAELQRGALHSVKLTARPALAPGLASPSKAPAPPGRGGPAYNPRLLRFAKAAAGARALLEGAPEPQRCSTEPTVAVAPASTSQSPPAAPSGTRLASKTMYSASIAWDREAGLGEYRERFGYRVLIRPPRDGKKHPDYFLVSTADALSTTVTGLTPGSTLAKATATKATSPYVGSAFGGALTVETLGTKPTTRSGGDYPIAVIATSSACQQLSVNWTVNVRGYSSMYPSAFVLQACPAAPAPCPNSRVCVTPLAAGRGPFWLTYPVANVTAVVAETKTVRLVATYEAASVARSEGRSGSVSSSNPSPPSSFLYPINSARLSPGKYEVAVRMDSYTGGASGYSPAAAATVPACALAGYNYRSFISLPGTAMKEGEGIQVGSKLYIFQQLIGMANVSNGIKVHAVELAGATASTPHAEEVFRNVGNTGSNPRNMYTQLATDGARYIFMAGGGSGSGAYLGYQFSTTLAQYTQWVSDKLIVYDIQARNSFAVDTLPAPAKRYGVHTCFYNKRLYVIGGWDGTASSTAWPPGAANFVPGLLEYVFGSQTDFTAPGTWNSLTPGGAAPAAVPAASALVGSTWHVLTATMDLHTLDLSQASLAWAAVAATGTKPPGPRFNPLFFRAGGALYVGIGAPTPSYEDPAYYKDGDLYQLTLASASWSSTGKCAGAALKLGTSYMHSFRPAVAVVDGKAYLVDTRSAPLAAVWLLELACPAARRALRSASDEGPQAELEGPEAELELDAEPAPEEQPQADLDVWASPRRGLLQAAADAEPAAPPVPSAAEDAASSSDGAFDAAGAAAADAFPEPEAEGAAAEDADAFLSEYAVADNGNVNDPTSPRYNKTTRWLAEARAAVAAAFEALQTDNEAPDLVNPDGADAVVSLGPACAAPPEWPQNASLGRTALLGEFLCSRAANLSLGRPAGSPFARLCALPVVFGASLAFAAPADGVYAFEAGGSGFHEASVVTWFLRAGEAVTVAVATLAPAAGAGAGAGALGLPCGDLTLDEHVVVDQAGGSDDPAVHGGSAPPRFASFEAAFLHAVARSAAAPARTARRCLPPARVRPPAPPRPAPPGRTRRRRRGGRRRRRAGGAVLLLGGARVTFDGCVFLSNAARAGGAVAVLAGSSARFQRSAFVGL